MNKLRVEEIVLRMACQNSIVLRYAEVIYRQNPTRPVSVKCSNFVTDYVESNNTSVEYTNYCMAQVNLFIEHPSYDNRSTHKVQKITDCLASGKKTSTYPHEDVERAEDVPDTCIAAAPHRDSNCNLKHRPKLHMKLYALKYPPTLRDKHNATPISTRNINKRSLLVMRNLRNRGLRCTGFAMLELATHYRSLKC
jgi:hypothetical protein